VPADERHTTPERQRPATRGAGDPPSSPYWTDMAHREANRRRHNPSKAWEEANVRDVERVVRETAARIGDEKPASRQVSKPRPRARTACRR
jgi:hypothetical protein